MAFPVMTMPSLPPALTVRILTYRHRTNRASSGGQPRNDPTIALVLLENIP
jgi:hypothetical protein